jgi:hypothetical protein
VHLEGVGDIALMQRKTGSLKEICEIPWCLSQEIQDQGHAEAFVKDWKVSFADA